MSDGSPWECADRAGTDAPGTACAVRAEMWPKNWDSGLRGLGGSGGVEFYGWVRGSAGVCGGLRSWGSRVRGFRVRQGSRVPGCRGKRLEPRKALLD